MRSQRSRHGTCSAHAERHTPRRSSAGRLLARAGAAAGAAALATLTACSTVGPQTIVGGRAAYTEAIARTDAQQMLATIVRTRFGETSAHLVVTSVVANVRVSTNVNVQAGIGPDESFAGAIVPFSGGALYEENPTITYAPLQGPQYLRELLSPVPVDLLVLLSQSSDRPGSIVLALVSEMNGVENPLFLSDPRADGESAERFVELVDMINELERGGSLALAALEAGATDAEPGGSFALLIEPTTDAQRALARQFMETLGVRTIGGDERRALLPIRFTRDEPGDRSIHLVTRSVYDLMRVAAASVEIGEEAERGGVARTFPPVGPVGDLVSIRRSSSRPGGDMIAFQYRDAWFSIDDADQASKSFFQLLHTLWSFRITASSGERPAPVLTVPVSR